MSAVADPVLVLAGGMSAEHDVSMRSGEHVAARLSAAGVAVDLLDVGPDLLGQLAHRGDVVIVPVLHGPSGEDGTLSEMLRLTGGRVVGTSPEGCRLAWDKSVASALVAAEGIRVPAAVTLTVDALRDSGLTRLVPAIESRLGSALVAKPNRGGSGFGITVGVSTETLADAVLAALGHDTTCRIEEQVSGRDVTVTVVDLGDGALACPPVEIQPLSGPYDFGARYSAGATEFHVPARLDAGVTEGLVRAAVRIHQRLGLGAISRTDWIVGEDGRPCFLEVDTSPGMTDTSTAPLGMAAGPGVDTVLLGLVAAAAPLS